MNYKPIRLRFLNCESEPIADLYYRTNFFFDTTDEMWEFVESYQALMKQKGCISLEVFDRDDPVAEVAYYEVEWAE